MKTTRFILLLVFCCFYLTTRAKITEIGVEIWIEPGDTKEQIDSWMKSAKDAKMSVVRIFLMWTHVEQGPDKWDFTIYDWLFSAAEREGIKLQVTLTANHPPPSYGKEYWARIHTAKIFSDDSLLLPAARYIGKVVNRYRDSPALENWWLMNEPSAFNDPTPYALNGFRMRMKDKYQKIAELNRKWMTSFNSFEEIQPIPEMLNSSGWAAAQPYLDWFHYCNEHLTNFQKWVHDEVSKNDTKHLFHTNPDDVFSKFHKQATGDWRAFLNSLGASIHPSWHFTMLKSNQYPMGIAATCELVKSNAAPHPFWISEIQAGNNIFSGNRLLCPTSNDIAQWTWTGIAQGAEKIIYWLLNSRPQGTESGEWAMLNTLNEPSERLQAATSVIDCVQKHKDFFETARPVESNVTVLLSPESNLTFQRKAKPDYEGADALAHMKASLAFYEVFSEMGIASRMCQTQDFDWENSRGKVAILANAISLPRDLYPKIQKFVTAGNKLIITGLTGNFDENEKNMFQPDSPFKDICGAEVQDIMLIRDSFAITFPNTVKLPARGWMGALRNYSASPIGKFNQYTSGVRNKLGQGEILWMPSNIDLGAWLYGNMSLSKFIMPEIRDFVKNQPFQFANKTEDITMSTMIKGDQFLTVINNGAEKVGGIALVNRLGKKPGVLFSTENRTVLPQNLAFKLAPHECLVLLWD
jgi:beta-galactosidase